MPVLIVLALLTVGVTWLDRRHHRRSTARAAQLAAARAAITRPAEPLAATEELRWRDLTARLNDLEP